MVVLLSLLIISLVSADTGSITEIITQNAIWETVPGRCIQGRLRSCFASSQSDQSLCCPHEEHMDTWLSKECPAQTDQTAWMHRLIWASTVYSRRHFSTVAHINTLTLKAQRKTASENVVCLCRLLNILADFSNLFLHTGKQYGSW